MTTTSRHHLRTNLQIDVASSTACKRSQVKPWIHCVSFLPFDYYEYEESL